MALRPLLKSQGKMRFPVVGEHLHLPPVSPPSHLFFTPVTLVSGKMLEAATVAFFCSWEEQFDALPWHNALGIFPKLLLLLPSPGLSTA